jgi:hypothetical protein
MIYYVIFTWMLIAFCDLPLVLFTAWKMRSARTRQGAKYLIVALLGSAVYDVIMLSLAVITLPHVRAEQIVNVFTLLFTLANTVRTLPTIALALYLLGLFSNGQKTETDRTEGS